MVRSTAAACLALILLCFAAAQQAGVLKKEVHVPIQYATCTSAGGCTPQHSALTMDAQWRWVHDARPDMYGNCMRGFLWNESIATDGETGASSCALEGIGTEEYETVYGVSVIPGGIQLKYKTGGSIGARLYMMETNETYKMFKLLNREFTFDVDLTSLECGMNGAVYFVEMDEDGGKARGGDNKAGAAYGTGYCDAQCPRHLKFINGEANVEEWNVDNSTLGHYGACCAEMDVFEANNAATSFTAHPCTTQGIQRCEGPTGCGEDPWNCECCDEAVCPCCNRYNAVCDKDGCDYNPFRLGNQTFFGEGPMYTLDTSKPFTVITQFVTNDNSDSGDLVEIRRLYKQRGKVFKNPVPQNLAGYKGDSLTDKHCEVEKNTFKEIPDFSRKGGLQRMGQVLGQGVVLVLSLWDDSLSDMAWLDSSRPTEKKPITQPGVKRGPCARSSGSPETLQRLYPNAYVRYANIMVGELGTTTTPEAEKLKIPLPEFQPPPIPTTTRGGGAVCCTYSTDKSDPCGTCGPGSADRTGYCATDPGTCQNCLGTWCPGGV